MFVLDCCDCEVLYWVVIIGGFNSEIVQDVMLGVVECCFGNDFLLFLVEWLMDNGLCYWVNEICQFVWMLGFELKNMVVWSLESNGIVESFVKMIKCDYISIMFKLDGLMVVKNFVEVFEYYNEWYLYSVLGYCLLWEYLWQWVCNGLSDNRCLEIQG